MFVPKLELAFSRYQLIGHPKERVSSKMASVFTYWQLPEEEAEFLDFLDSTGIVVAYPNHGVKTPQEADPQPIRVFWAKNAPLRCMLGLDSNKASTVLEFKSQGDEQFYSVSLMNSCVIGYSRPNFRNGNHLGQSNLAAYLQYSDGSKKPDWFWKWTNQVFRWAKKKAADKQEYHGYFYPATQRVVEEVHKKRIILTF